MFILGWVIILILRSNNLVIPQLISFIIGLLAIVEAVAYVIPFVLWIGLGLYMIIQRFRK